MTPWLFALVALAGGIGAAARFALDSAIQARRVRALPWGTIVVNLTGSLALGMLVGLALGSAVPPEWQAILGIGFLGGYTTFSTASYETVRLLQQRRRLLALVNGLGVLVACTALAGLGTWIGAGLVAGTAG